MKSPRCTAAFGKRRGRKIKVAAGSAGVWKFSFTCGSRPILPGGAVSVFCEVPKFWLGLVLQNDDKAKIDYAWLETSRGVEAEIESLAPYYKNLNWATIRLPRGLKEGERVSFNVGTAARPAYAIAHCYRKAVVSMRADYDADGVFQKIWPPLVVSIVPGDAHKLRLVAPSVVRQSEPFDIKLRVEDANSNIGAKLAGEVELSLAGTARTETMPAKGVLVSKGWRVEEEGTFRVRARSLAGPRPEAWSNPVRCTALPEARLFWGDCHNHSGWTDGVGTFEENARFARDRAFLDFFAISDHLGARPNYAAGAMDKDDTDWVCLGQRLEELHRQFYRKGRFAILMAHEYTPGKFCKKPTGDLCIYSRKGRWLDMPMAIERGELIAACRELGMLAVPHVGGRFIDWEDFPYDETATPLVEVASMHERSEWFMQEGLQQGYRLGACGMADGHFGMPGYDCWALHGRTPRSPRRNFSVQSGLTAVIADELTREAVFDALAARRCYATTGARILLDVAVAGNGMGTVAATNEAPRVDITVSGTAPLLRVDVIRGDRLLRSFERFDESNAELSFEDARPPAGETYYYVRVVQRDFAVAWSSPVWVTYGGADAAGTEEVEKLPAWNEGPEWPAERPADCAPGHVAALEKILEERGLAARFIDVREVGVFEENRGRFRFFRATDAEEAMPVHIHHYFEFPDDRLYIATGHSDYGQYSNIKRRRERIFTEGG